MSSGGGRRRYIVGKTELDYELIEKSRATVGSAEPPASRLSMQQLRAIGLLVGGMAVRQVSELLGVNEGTVSQWLRWDPDFQVEYEHQRMLCYASDLQYARKRLREHLDSDSPRLQQGAARILLEHDVQSRRYQSNAMQSAVIDKLIDALRSAPKEEIEAEYRELAESADVTVEG